MQNLPDKGVSGYSYYLLAEYTVTGLTESVLESQGRSAEMRETFPFLGPTYNHGRNSAGRISRSDPLWR